MTAAFVDDVSALLNEYLCNNNAVIIDSAIAPNVPLVRASALTALSACVDRRRHSCAPTDPRTTCRMIQPADVAIDLKASLDTLATVANAAIPMATAVPEKPYLTTPVLVKVPTQRGVDGYVVLWYVTDEQNGAVHNKNKSAIVTVVEPEKHKSVASPRKVYTSLSKPGTEMRQNIQINGWKLMFAVADNGAGTWQPLDVFRVQTGGGGIRNTAVSHNVNALHQAGKYDDILNMPLPQHIATQLAAASGIAAGNKKRALDDVADVAVCSNTKRRTVTTKTKTSSSTLVSSAVGQRRGKRAAPVHNDKVDNSSGGANDQQQLMTAQQVQQLLDAMRQQHEMQMAQLKQQYDERCNALEQRLNGQQQQATATVDNGNSSVCSTVTTETTTTEEEIMQVINFGGVSNDSDAVGALFGSSNDEHSVLIASLYGN